MPNVISNKIALEGIEPNAISILKLEDYGITLVIHANTENPYGYRFYVGDELLADSDEFRPAGGPAADAGSIYAMGELLFWMTMKEEDYEEETFKNHTKEHLLWLSTAGIAIDDLQSYIQELEDEDSTEHENAVKFFSKGFEILC